MTEWEIRIVGAKTEWARCLVIRCVSDYERHHVKTKTRAAGDYVSYLSGAVRIYHTEKTIVGLYQGAHQ